MFGSARVFGLTSHLPPGARRDPELLGHAILRAVCAHCDSRNANLAGSHARGPGNALIEEELQTFVTFVLLGF